MVIYLPVAADSEFRPIFEDKFFTRDFTTFRIYFSGQNFFGDPIGMDHNFFTFKFVKKLRSDQRNLRSNFSAG